MGKAIYCPKKSASEYSKWACNFFVGCSNECSYCYLKKGIVAKVLGGNVPKLKACFENMNHAINIFVLELTKNLSEIRKHGLFFSFTTDPLLAETISLTELAIEICQQHNVPVKILTKRADIKNHLEGAADIHRWDRSLIAIGWTLTGHDELEPFASSNNFRIQSMRYFKEKGYRTFASIEPIIDFPSSKAMVEKSLEYCDLYKIGLESGKKYDVVEAQGFIEWLNELEKPKIYLKESLQKLSLYTNAELDDYFVERDYNIFE